jgi:hypothetical protein
MNTQSLLATARRATWPIALAVSSALAGSLAGQTSDSADAAAGRADRALPNRSPAASRKDDERLGERLREGTRITDVQGTFQFSGDRVAFHPDGKSHLDGKAHADGKGHPNGKDRRGGLERGGLEEKGESFRVLENLALERINRELGQARGNLQWTVSGIVTEFRGNNYLLVTRAVVKSAESSP